MNLILRNLRDLEYEFLKLSISAKINDRRNREGTLRNLADVYHDDVASDKLILVGGDISMSAKQWSQSIL